MLGKLRNVTPKVEDNEYTNISDGPSVRLEPILIEFAGRYTDSKEVMPMYLSLAK
jgi:hypothetical protein